MGNTIGTSSVNKSTDLKTLCNNAIMPTVMSCITSSAQSQTLNISGNAGNVDASGISLNQGSSVNISCLLTANNVANMSNQIASTLTQAATSQGESLSASKTNAEVTSDLSTQIVNNINTSTTSEITNAINQSQSINVINNQGNISLSGTTLNQTASIVAQAIINTTAVSSVIGNVANQLQQTTSTTQTNPLTNILGTAIEGIGSLFNSPGFITFAILGLIVFGMVFFLYISARK